MVEGAQESLRICGGSVGVGRFTEGVDELLTHCFLDLGCFLSGFGVIELLRFLKHTKVNVKHPQEHLEYGSFKKEGVHETLAGIRSYECSRPCLVLNC